MQSSSAWGVAPRLASCHTRGIRRQVRRGPCAGRADPSCWPSVPHLRGLAVPGIRWAREALEMGDHKDAYQVIGLTRDGTDEVVANYP